MENTEKYIDMLSWNATEEEQRCAVDYLTEYYNKSPQDCVEIIRTKGKDIWENSAKIFCQLDEPIFMQYLPRLLLWLKDPNWPGAMVIFEHLMTVTNGEVDDAITKALEFAKENNKGRWQMVLEDLVKERRIAQELL